MLPLILALTACDPYRHWPEPEAVFPWVHTAEVDLEPWEEVRWETGTWNPSDDPDQAGLYLLKAARHRTGAPPESMEHFEVMRERIPPLPEVGVRLSLVGDLMWVGDNWDAYALPAAPLLDGELRIGNLETPTSPDHPIDLSELGPYTFNAPPELLDGLPVDLLQLNNNHSLDVGDAGLEATLDQVEARGIRHTGVDSHHTVEVGGLELAVLAYTWGLNDPDAPTAHDLHVVPFGHLDEALDLSGLEAEVAAARQRSDAVILLVHWGFEYEYYADPHFLVLGRRMVAAGADLVVGSGPHVVQPPEICSVNQPEEVPGIGSCSVRTEDDQPRTAAILYSLGNFGTVMATEPCRTGLVATVALDPDVVGLGWAAASTVDGPEVLPTDEVDDPEVAAELERLTEHLGEGWRR